MGVEHVMYIGLAAMLFRYIWKLVSGWLGTQDGAVGQLGVAMGGIAQ